MHLSIRLPSYIKQFVVGLCVFSSSCSTVLNAFTEETVFFDVPDALVTDPIPDATAQLLAVPDYPIDAARLTLISGLYVPDSNSYGVGPYPAVIILHGSGGVWSNDLIPSGLGSQFEEWGELLADLGYLVCFPDSYNPRGIPANFGGRRPHYDPLLDDHLCSPNYERPKDVIAALTYLQSRDDVDVDNIALMGFSHGAQSGINAILDASVDLVDYTVSYIDLVEIPNSNPVAYQEDDDAIKDVDSPVRIPENLPFPKLCIFYYGGGSHYGYHGSASSMAAGRYMFDRRTKVLMFHGTEDSLMGVDDADDPLPLTGNMYPIRQVVASSAQAALIGVSDPMQLHLVMSGVEHSFDRESIVDQNDWDTEDEDPDQKAKRIARDEVLNWLEAQLKPSPTIGIALGDEDDEIELSVDTSIRQQYLWRQTTDLNADWLDLDGSFDGDGTSIPKVTSMEGGSARFYRIEHQAKPLDIEAIEHTGFFLEYGDFDFED